MSKNKITAASPVVPKPTAVASPATPTGMAVASTSTSMTTTAPGGVSSVSGLINPGLSPQGVASPKKYGIQIKINERLAGLQQCLPSDIPLTVNGQSLTVAQIITALQAVAALYTTLNTAEQQGKTAITQARQAINAELPTVSALITGLDNTLRGYFGKGNPLLADFGIASGARKASSSVTLAQAAGSRTLTRDARHTMGKKQRLAVKGGQANVQLTAPDGSVIAGSTPTVSESTPAPAATSNQGVSSGK
jgi:hypothetical protein